MSQFSYLLISTTAIQILSVPEHGNLPDSGLGLVQLSVGLKSWHSGKKVCPVMVFS